MLAYKFVSWEVPALETLKDSIEYKLALKLEQGKAFTREEKNQLAKMLMHNHVLKLQGWLFPLASLPTFYVEQYGQIYKVRAHDKTAVRAAISGRITKITVRD